MKTVGVIGGGIAGLTAADELSKRGYEVHVFEQHPAQLGGKARSHGFRAQNGWRPLPAEHGFRFFPGFYENVVETMREIPRDGRTVADRLANAKFLRYSFSGARVGCQITPLGHSGLIDMAAQAFLDLFDDDEGENQVYKKQIFEGSDLAYFGGLLAAVWSVPDEARLALEERSFKKFVLDEFPSISGLRPSDTFREFLGKGATRMLVAAQADHMSARTGLVTLARLLHPSVLTAGKVDRFLLGPTSPEWIDPWVQALGTGAGGRSPVTFHMGHSAIELDLTGKRITSFKTSPGRIDREFDYVVLAVPHAIAEDLLKPHLADLTDELKNLDALVSDWMCGVQYYLDRPVDICTGHVMYVDSPWALTSVNQAAIWAGFDWQSTGDGSIRDVISLCVSNWDEPGLTVRKPAKECTRDEIREEVWHQMCSSLNDVETTELPVDQDEIVRAFAIDPGVTYRDDGTVRTNLTPLFINTTNSWFARPRADAGMENLFLAGDWVKTNADLATMESANEAGRRAANAILDRENDGQVPILELDEMGLL